MESGYVLGPRGRFDAKRNDRIEIERRCVNDSRALRTMIEKSARNQRAGIEADGQRSMRSRPRTVMRSGAPGPAPMKCTVIVVW